MSNALHSPLRQIGSGSTGHLGGIEHDPEVMEFAWLEAHGAADATPFDLAAIAGMNAETVNFATVLLHPATRIISLGKPREFRRDGGFSDSYVLLTRPGTEVVLTVVDAAVFCLIKMLDRPRTLGELLEYNPKAVTILVETGALVSVPEILL